MTEHQVFGIVAWGIVRFRPLFNLDKNPICTLKDYFRPSHEGYRNTIELPKGNNVVPLLSNIIRDFTKPVKVISLPQDVPSTSDRRLIKLKNQVQCLMDAYLAPRKPIQVNKITSSCEIYTGPHDNQYCMENPNKLLSIMHPHIPTKQEGAPPAGPPPPQNNNGLPPVVRPNGPAPRTMEDLCQPNSIHTFDDMMRKFLSKYFPPSMVTKLRNEIIKFRQEPHESLFEASTRDKTFKTVSSATTNESPKVIRQLDMLNKNFQEMMKQMQTVKSVDTKCETYGGPHSYTECPAAGVYTQKATYATTGNYNSEGLESCNALADLDASINLMPLFIWNKLSLPDLTFTRMTLELTTRTYAYPVGIAEDVFVQVGKFTFPTDFVVIDFDVDNRVPLILGRRFLRTAHALVYHGIESINMINFIDITCEYRFPEVLKFKKSNHPSSGSTTSLFDSSPSLAPFETSDSILEEFDDKLALLDPIPPEKEDNNFDFETDLREIEFLLRQDPSTESNIETINPILEQFIDEPALDYLPPLGDDDDDLFDLKSNNDEWKKLLYGDCYKDINSEKAKNKDSKMKSLVIEAHC
nr:reverse transcriptase domain-containing protein [Tanacetum cinerariifolium]